jgi:hypothetical protein
LTTRIKFGGPQFLPRGVDRNEQPITPRPIAGSRNIEARPVLHLKRRRERFGERSQMPAVDG